MYPWKSLVKAGSNGVAATEYGRKNMYDMMMVYDEDHRRYVKLVAHGYCILAEAVEANLPYQIKCPALLLCGEKDKAGSTKRYNIKWHESTGLPLIWVENAGHNSNADAPDFVNAKILEFLDNIRAHSL